MDDLFDRLTIALADRYTLERELGQGGMAVVYRAHDQKLGRDVALKVVRPEFAASLGSERFLREVAIAAQLAHPNILALHDRGEADGLLYYTMPVIEGETLRDRLTRERQLPIDDALQITREVADALGYAHARGIVHRDIKPENILFQEGHAVVADFGIAKAVAAAGATSLTETGMAVGTPAYMSPEQATGQADLDARSDIYALGCVVFEMLSGETPYSGPTPQAVMAKKLSEPLPRISVVREAVPAAVEVALTKALAKNPADRYRTAHEFAEALTAEGVTVPRPRAPRRLQAVIFGSTFIAALGAAAAIAAFWPGKGWQPDPEVIAVAPFENRTGDPAFDDYGGLLATNVQYRLDQAEIGKVFPQTTVHSALQEAGDGAAPFSVLSQSMGAGVVVTGEIFLRGDSLEIRTYCLDGRTGEDLSPIPPTRGLPTEDDIITQVGDRVTAVLGQHLDADYAWREFQRPPISLDVYRAYRQTWDDWDRGGGQGESFQSRVRRTIDGLHRVALMDSTYMAPRIDMWHLSTFLGRTAERDSLEVILEQSRHLMTSSQASWIEWLRLEFHGDRESEAALRVARKASEHASTEFALNVGISALRLNYVEEAIEAFALWDKGNGEFLETFVRDQFEWFYDYARALHQAGRHEKELEIVLEGRRRNPENPDLQRWELYARTALGQLDVVDSLAQEVPRFRDWPDMELANLLRYHGHPERARAFMEGEVRRFASDSFYIQSPARRAGVLIQLGRVEEARAILDTALATRPNDDTGFLGYLGVAAALAGDTATAREIEGMVAPQERLPWMQAEIAAALGDKDRAIGFARQIRPTFGLWFYYRIGLPWQNLRGYPPWEEFLRPKHSR